MRRLALILATLAAPAAAEISPCDLSGASVPERVATLEGAILYGTWAGLAEAIPNVPEDSRKTTADWVDGLGFPLLRCDTVYNEVMEPGVLRRAVVFHGREPQQMVGLYIDALTFRDRTEIVLFNLTRSMEDLMRSIR